MDKVNQRGKKNDKADNTKSNTGHFDVERNIHE